MRPLFATMHQTLQGFLRHATALCTTLAVALVFALVVARYLFGVGSPAVQDAAQWLHAGAVMLGLSVALRAGAHVRIDVLSHHWSPRTRARVELVGVVLLLWPFCLAIGWLSWDYVGMSWAVAERSANSGGLPGLFLVKSLLPVGSALLALQAIDEALRAWPQAMAPEAKA